MKKKLIMFMVTTLLIFGVGSGQSIKASDGPAYLIADDYIIINYEKYDLVDNKVIYDGLEFDLIDNNLVGYDKDGIQSIILLPVAENKITDKELVSDLNMQAFGTNNGTRVIPSQRVNLPYTGKVPYGEWSAQSPCLNLLPGYAFLYISNMPLTANKTFSIGFTYCDIAGDWFSYKFHSNWDFSNGMPCKYQVDSSIVCGIISLGVLYGTPGFTYTVKHSKTALV